jgi:threonine/homoserine/homoserine lactone efflux protein
VNAAAGSELTELIPLALVIALSPLSIIPAILVLHSPRPRPTGLAFLLGWVAGLVVLTVAFIAVSGLLGGTRSQPPGWASWLRITLGAALIAFGIYRWLTRHTKPHQIPGTRHITEAGPGKALLVGGLLTVANPKVLFMCAAAGLAIGTAGVGPDAGLVTAVFVAVSASTVALPILGYLATGNRLDPALAKLETWMAQNNGTLVAGILVVIGLLVLYKGIHGL